MSIEFADFTTLVDAQAVAELSAREEALTAAILQIEQEHPGYKHTYSTEIRCIAWNCGRFMEVTAGPGHAEMAADAFAAHRAERVDARLAEWFPTPEDEDLGN